VLRDANPGAIDRNLVLRELLEADEIAWLDAYHRRVREVVTPLVDAETAAGWRRPRRRSNKSVFPAKAGTHFSGAR